MLELSVVIDVLQNINCDCYTCTGILFVCTTPNNTFFLDGAHSGQSSADPAKHFCCVEIRERADPAEDPIASRVSHFH